MSEQPVEKKPDVSFDSDIEKALTEHLGALVDVKTDVAYVLSDIKDTREALAFAQLLSIAEKIKSPDLKQFVRLILILRRSMGRKGEGAIVDIAKAKMLGMAGLSGDVEGEHKSVWKRAKEFAHL